MSEKRRHGAADGAGGNLPALIDEMNARIGKATAEFEAALPRGVTVAQLKQDALNCLRTNPKLAQAHAPTVLGALMTCAQLGLRPGVAGLGQAWLVPFTNRNRGSRLEAQLIIGYRGYCELAYRHPRVVGISSHIVREGDTFEMDIGQNHLVHKMPPLKVRRGPAIGFYAMAHIEGPNGTQRILTEPMNLQEMQEHRDKYAMGKVYRDGRWTITGPWADHFDEMARKTMIRARLVKIIPTALDLAVGLTVDEGVRTDFDPTADPAKVTEHVTDEQPEKDPSQPIRESVNLRASGWSPGGITPEQDRTIARLLRDRKISKDAALSLVEEMFGTRKSARQLTEQQAAQLIARLKTIPVPTLEGDVVGDRPVPGRAQHRTPNPGPDPAPPAQGQAEASPLGPGRVFTPEQHDKQVLSRKATNPQMRTIHGLLRRLGVDGDGPVRQEIARILDQEVTTRTQLTYGQADQVIAHVTNRVADQVREQIATTWRRLGGADADLPAVFAEVTGLTHAQAWLRHLDRFAEALASGQVHPPGRPGGDAAADAGEQPPGPAPAPGEQDEVPEADRLEARIRRAWQDAGGTPATLARVFFSRTGAAMGDADEATLEAFLRQVTSGEISPEGEQPPPPQQ